MRLYRRSLLVLLSFLILVPAAGAWAEKGVITVETFDQEFINWATPHEATFQFPPASQKFKQVMLTILLECPDSPGDCDPWDRTAYIEVLRDTGEVDASGSKAVEPVEIARFITPYDITGEFGEPYGTGPGSCSWVFDVTNYMSLLRDNVTLNLFISSWIGGDKGWLVTATFDFTEGKPVRDPYKVINLWHYDYVIYGNPNNPIEDHLAPVPVPIDAEAISGIIVSTATGHGQGNTDNAAEFARKWHKITADEFEYQWYLWRDNCEENPCSGQGGTWWYSRAGWCPGDACLPVKLGIDSVIAPGETMVFDYDIQPFENCCRSDNPECTPEDPCCVFGDCGNYPPGFRLTTQLILFRESSGCAIPAGSPSAVNGGLVATLLVMLLLAGLAGRRVWLGR